MCRSGSLIYYYYIFSQPSRAIKILLDSNNVQYTAKYINLFKGEHLQEDYKLVNKFQKVPALNVNDLVLTESVAIARYLCREQNIAEHWYPKDSKKQAEIDEFLEWHHSELRYPCLLYFFHKLSFQSIGGLPVEKQPSKETVNHAIKQMEDACDKMEMLWLNDTPYICGNNITVADIFGACELEQPKMAGYDPRSGRPKLSAWFERIEQDLFPHYTDAHKSVNKEANKYKNSLKS